MLEQEKHIKLVKRKAEEDDLVEAVLMYGSFTQGGGDEFSDVEFYVSISGAGERT